MQIVAFIVSHFTWLNYFTEQQRDINVLTLLGFFFVMLWLIPLGLLISLSVNENILPGIGPSTASGNGLSGSSKQVNIFKFIFDIDKIREYLNTFQITKDISSSINDKYNKKY